MSYRTFFNATPTIGESQLYDDAMLIGYAAWYRHFNPELSLQKSLRAVVSGEDLNMGSWTGEDMGLVVDALAAGKSPYIRGASGHLRFDAKVFTNVLATTYYNFKVYNGQYIILDYNTSDGGNCTDATLAGWNWKASQMLFFTAANGDETSKADVFNTEMKVWMSNRFTSTFIEQITGDRNVAMRDLYYRLFINTVGSHVMVYNAENYGNLYSAGMSEFINFKKQKSNEDFSLQQSNEDFSPQQSMSNNHLSNRKILLLLFLIFSAI